MDIGELENRFKYHQPLNDIVKAAHEKIRKTIGEVATSLFNELLPEGREKSTAITKLEEAMFWANAAIARTNHSG